jgi:pimeloyl-ACP methyl ester carboxylesterase
MSSNLLGNQFPIDSVQGIMTLRAGVLALGLFVPGLLFANAQNDPKADLLPRADVTHTISDARKVVSQQGVDDTRVIPVNGTQQAISVRGKDRRNPVLLILHGGPGSPEMPDDWTFQTPLEDFFTVVEWDQRGAGKTYSLNDPKAIEPTMTLPQMVSDTEVVIEYLRQTYGKQKIVLLGHSWGSVLGVLVAERHPDWLYAYVGVGRINTQRNEEEGYSFALAEAKSQGNAEAVKELDGIASYPGNVATLSFDKIGVQRKCLMYYGGLAWGRQDFKWDSSAWELSPNYSEKELDAVDAGSLFSLTHLMPTLLAVNLEQKTIFKCPVFIFVGRHDYATSHTLAEKWFRGVRAPEKELIWFEDASHMIMQEEPGRFLEDMVRDVRPIAVKAGDAAPGETVEK